MNIKVKSLIIGSFLLPTITIVSSVSLSSCHMLDEKDYRQFIHERSFSIGCFNNITHSGVIGTAWILHHETGLTYDCLTNLHVALPQLDITNSSWYYGVSSSIDDGSGAAQYIPLSSIEYHINKSIVNPASIDEIPILWSVDMAIATVTFNNDNNNFIKNLLQLNQNYGVDKDFIETETIGTSIRRRTLFCGGYPAANWKDVRYHEPTWYFGHDSVTEVDRCYSTTNPNLNHLIYPDKGAPATETRYLDMADLILFEPHKIGKGPLNNLGGGASGSLVIDENFKLVGLYWGGFVDENDNYYGGVDIFISSLSGFNGYNKLKCWI